MDQRKRDNSSSENELPIWEREPYKGWAVLSYEESEPKRVRCILCRGKEMQAIRATLDGHAGTEQHKQRKKLREKDQQQSATSSQITEISHTPSLESRKRSRLLTQETTTAQPDSSEIPESASLKFFKLKLLLCKVIHSSTLHDDQTTEILSGLSDDSSLLSFVGAHEKKCVEIMKIIAENIREELCFDIGNQPYSIIIDEYQWASEEWYWCLCIKYFSERKKSIATNFLGLIRVSRTIGDHDELEKLIIDHLENFKLDLQNLIGFGVEAANWKLHTEYNSFYRSLSKKKPTLLLNPLLPHSLDICFSRAFAKLGDECMDVYGYSWISIYNHFAQEPISFFSYSKIFSNVKPEVKKKLKNRFSVSEESWLLGVDVIDAIVCHWDWLKEYFIKSDMKWQEVSMKVIFNDNKIHLYYIIISEVLRRVHRLYSRLTEKDAPIECFFPQLYGLLLELMQMVILPEHMGNLVDMTKTNVEKIEKIFSHEELPVIPHDQLDFGSTFKANLPAWETPSLTRDTIIEIKKGGMNLILELCRQIIERFPDDSELYVSLLMFSPENSVKERTLVSSIADLPQKLTDFSLGNTIYSQYMDFVKIRWSKVSSPSPEAFWFNIRDDKDKNGQYRFREIANLALKALSSPFGNNNIEYIFSLTKSLQIYSRDQIPVDVLDAIIRIRYHFFVEKLNCNSFELTPTIVEKLRTITCDESCDPGNIIFELIHSTAP